MTDIVERFLRNIDADPSNGKLVLRGEFADLLIQEQKKSADEIERLHTQNERLHKAFSNLKSVFRVNMLRAFPEMSHEEIDAEIDKALGETLKQSVTTSAAISELEDDKGAKFNSVDDLMADLNAENERMREYQELIWFIANDYYELSYDKIKWQRDDWRKRCRKLIEEDND